MNLSKLQDAINRSVYSKKEIATKSGISPQALHGILNGADPKVSTLESIAKVIDLKISILFDETGIEIRDNDRSFNSNADEIIKDLTGVIRLQEERIALLTDRLLASK